LDKTGTLTEGKPKMTDIILSKSSVILSKAKNPINEALKLIAAAKQNQATL